MCSDQFIYELHTSSFFVASTGNEKSKINKKKIDLNLKI